MAKALGIQTNRRGHTLPHCPALVTYADDLVTLGHTRQDCAQARERLDAWLATRGLRLSEKKTRIVHLRQGFNFLGFTIRHYRTRSTKRGWVCLTVPSREAVRTFKGNLKAAFMTARTWKVDDAVTLLNKKIVGWANYFRIGASKRTFSKLDAWMWRREERFARRRHPNKSWRWIQARYWGRMPSRKDRWVFQDKASGHYLWKLAWTRIRRHVMVKGDASPDDAPMQAAYQHKYYKPMRNLMKGLLGDCLKDNDFLHRAVLTGIVRVAKEDIFSDLNNPGVYGVLDDPFASRFGFTEHEVKELLRQRGRARRFPLVRQSYNGYRFGHGNPCEVYNPWSVINDLCKPTPQPGLHWVNTSTNHLVHELVSRADTTVKRGLRELMDEATGHTSKQPVREYVPLREVEHDPKNLWGLLLAAGYLTATHVEESEDDSKTVQLRIPNAEVRRVYSGLINRWLRGGKSGDGGGIELLEALVMGNLEEFAAGFEQLVAESVSVFDTGGNKPERFYHAFVLGMVTHLRGRYVIDSEQFGG
ncbi:MAG: AAA family ATPase, partial [Myxococcota bacterium]